MLVSVFVYVYLCIRSHIHVHVSHYNFVKCGPIVMKLDMEVVEYDICIVMKYYVNRSKVTEIVKKHINVDNAGTLTFQIGLKGFKVMTQFLT